jgi:NADH:ubiquinone oxidoreductase subunit 6 (subunit J)
MITLHYFFSFLLLLSSIFVFISKNPVHSVLFLILTFCNASGILFLFNAEFLGLVFIIIYVVDHISSINAIIFTMPSIIPGPSTNSVIPTKIKKSKKLKK